MTLLQLGRTGRSLHPVEGVDRPIQTFSKLCMKFGNAGLAAIHFLTVVSFDQNNRIVCFSGFSDWLYGKAAHRSCAKSSIRTNRSQIICMSGENPPFRSK